MRCKIDFSFLLGVMVLAFLFAHCGRSNRNDRTDTSSPTHISGDQHQVQPETAGNSPDLSVIVSTDGTYDIILSKDMTEGSNALPDYSVHLARYLNQGSIDTSFFQNDVRTSLALFDQLLQVPEELGIRPVIDLYRALETDDLGGWSSLLWSTLSEDHYLDLPNIDSIFIESRDGRIRPLLHYAVSSRDTPIDDRIAAAARLARLDDPSGYAFLESMLNDSAYTHLRAHVERQLRYLQKRREQ